MIQIDQDFERRLLAGQSADVQVIADGRNSNTAGTAMGYVRCHRRSVQRRLAAAPWPRSAHPRHDAGVVQPEPRDPLAHDSGMIGTLTMLQTLLLTAHVRGSRAGTGHL